ncbi:MAG: alpha/beta hydrolase family protein [Corynebacterium sp.]|uniref:alpha/beta hydrolase n=1 Tax=Corynebacterium sp. TaxID=1720 RepID=UPI0026DC6E91|nr:alpha/beta hydrolase family protein [Corynebacterium sp.]MDO4762499.1 alpha/beta hydrolase family protein [Corynebacterium sp.]
MLSSHTSVALLSALSATALIMGTPAAAHAHTPQAGASAQLSSTSSDTFMDTYNQLVGQAFALPGVPSHLENIYRFKQNSPLLSGLHAPGFFAADAWYNTEAPQDYAQPRLVKIEKDTGLRVERWFIESPAMRRVVEVQIMRAVDSSKPAPMIYLFDGATAPSRNGWLRRGNIETTFANEQVTAVMPTQASGSSYLDWAEEDELIGKPMWETFLTKELPPILDDAANGLNFNGKRFIGGLSMGAGGAVRLANAHPELFDGAIGLSGCYSNTTTMGRFMIESIANSVNADHTKMFGTSDNPDRLRTDVVANPEGLRSMPVYLFTADGHVTPRDIENYRHQSVKDLPGAVILELATDKCTRELDESMKAHGMTHQKVVLQHGGVHDWPYYAEQFPFAWKHVSEQADAWNTKG